MEDIENNAPADIVVIIRPSLKRACCEGDACRAAIFNQILYCIAWKRKYDKDYWYGTYEEIHTKLLDESWGLSKVIKEVKALVSQGFIEQRRNPNKGWDQTRQYLFGEEQAKKFREACEKAEIPCIEHRIGFPPDVIHLLFLTNGISETNKCSCQIQQIDSANSTNASGKNNDAIPKTPTEETRRNGREKGDDSFIHSSLPSVSLDQCLDAVESFAEGYGDRDPVACRLEAEQLYRVSGLDSNAFWDEMFAVKETLGKKSQTMGIFFKRLRKELGREH